MSLFWFLPIKVKSCVERSHFRVLMAMLKSLFQWHMKMIGLPRIHVLNKGFCVESTADLNQQRFYLFTFFSVKSDLKPWGRISFCPVDGSETSASGGFLIVLISTSAKNSDRESCLNTAQSTCLGTYRMSPHTCYLDFCSQNFSREIGILKEECKKLIFAS